MDYETAISTTEKLAAALELKLTRRLALGDDVAVDDLAALHKLQMRLATERRLLELRTLTTQHQPPPHDRNQAKPTGGKRRTTGQHRKKTARGG